MVCIAGVTQRKSVWRCMLSWLSDILIYDIYYCQVFFPKSCQFTSTYLDLFRSLNIYFKTQSELYISVYNSNWMGFSKHARPKWYNWQTIFLFKNLNVYKLNKLRHGKCFVRFYSLVEEHQKIYPFATLTRSFSDTPQLKNKNRTRAFSMEYSLYLDHVRGVARIFP